MISLRFSTPAIGGGWIGLQCRAIAIRKLADWAGLCVTKVVKAFAGVWVREELADHFAVGPQVVCKHMLYPAGLYLFRYSWSWVLYAILCPFVDAFLLEPFEKFLVETLEKLFSEKNDSINSIAKSSAKTIISLGLFQIIIVSKKIFNVLCVHEKYVLPVCPRFNLSIFNLLYNNMEYN